MRGGAGARGNPRAGRSRREGAGAGKGRGCGEEQARGCGEGARVREAASAGQPDGVRGEESAQQQTTPVRPWIYSRDDL